MSPMTTRSRLLAPALLAAVACRTAVPTPAPAPAPGDEARARAAITRAAQALSDRYMRGDAPGIVALYLPGGILLPPSGGLVQGEAALLRAWTLRPGTRVVEHRTQADSIIVVGPVAYDWGTYQWRTVDAGGGERTQRGRYVIVWRETEPGVWKMHVDAWSAAPARP